MLVKSSAHAYKHIVRERNRYKADAEIPSCLCPVAPRIQHPEGAIVPLQSAARWRIITCSTGIVCFNHINTVYAANEDCIIYLVEPHHVQSVQTRSTSYEGEMRACSRATTLRRYFSTDMYANVYVMADDVYEYTHDNIMYTHPGGRVWISRVCVCVSISLYMSLL